MSRLLALAIVALLIAAGGFRLGRSTPGIPPPGAGADPAPGRIAASAEGASGSRSGMPELPRAQVDTAPVTPTGRVLAVPAQRRRDATLNLLRGMVTLPAGGPLQAALDAAKPGDVVELEAGATFVGNFVLRNTAEGDWITVRSSAYARLPPPGSRVTPAGAALMARITTPNARPAIRTAPGARGVRLIGIEVTPAPGVFVDSLVELGEDETSRSALPSRIVIDRSYLHGDPVVGGRRGVAMNGADLAVIDSYLAGFAERGQDSQAIMGWNGPGPFKIANNYLEAAGENVMFGGDDPRIPGLVPSDIEIRGNRLVKPLSWREHDPAFAGTPWTVKNLLELKNARRVLVEGNLFEQNWAQTQHGLAIVLTPRNQHGGAPWSTVEDVTLRRNIIRASTGGVFLLGWDTLRPSRQLRRVLITDNLFAEIGAFPETSLPNEGVLFLISDGPADVVIDHNTGLQTGAPIRATAQVEARWPAAGFVFTNNMVLNNEGVDGAGSARDTLARRFPGAVFTGNVLAGGDPGSYPPGNLFPPSLETARMIAFARGRAGPVTPRVGARAGTGGRAAGADLAALAASIPGWRRP